MYAGGKLVRDTDRIPRFAKPAAQFDLARALGRLRVGYFHHERRPALGRLRHTTHVRAFGYRAQPTAGPRFVGHLDAKIPPLRIRALPQQNLLWLSHSGDLNAAILLHGPLVFRELGPVKDAVVVGDHAVDGIRATE